MSEPTKTAKKDDPNALEGEGSYTAAQHYRAGVEETVKSGKVAEGAKEAEEALDGPEGAALREAEAKAKEGKPAKH